MEVVAQKVHGTVETEIFSDERDIGAGIFTVRVHSRGISLKALGDKEWKHFTFTDLELMNIRELLLDTDVLMERYNAGSGGENQGARGKVSPIEKGSCRRTTHRRNTPRN